MGSDRGSAGAFRSSQQGVVAPVGDGLFGTFGCGDDAGVFGGGEADAADLGAGLVAEGWASGSGAHDSQNSGHEKSLTSGYICGHNKCMTTRSAQHATSKAADVQVGDVIRFVPGGRPIKFARIDAEQHLHPALNMTYRLAYEFDDTGYVLFDEQTLWVAP